MKTEMQQEFENWWLANLEALRATGTTKTAARLAWERAWEVSRRSAFRDAANTLKDMATK